MKDFLTQIFNSEHLFWTIIAAISGIITVSGIGSLFNKIKSFFLHKKEKELSLTFYEGVFILWNSGYKTIYRSDIAKKKRLGFPINSDFDTSKKIPIKLSDDSMEVKTEIIQDKPNQMIIFDFDFIEKGQGFVFQIPYNNISPKEFECKIIDGEFRPCPKVIPILKKAFLTTSYKEEEILDRIGNCLFSVISKFFQCFFWILPLLADVITAVVFGISIFHLIRDSDWHPVEASLESAKNPSTSSPSFDSSSSTICLITFFACVIIFGILYIMHYNHGNVPKRLISLAKELKEPEDNLTTTQADTKV